MTDGTILDFSLREIARRLADGQVSAGTVLEAASARRDPSLDAYVAWAPNGAARLTELALPGAAEVHELCKQGGIVSAELASFLGTRLPDWLETLYPDVRRRMERGGALEAREFLRAPPN